MTGVGSAIMEGWLLLLDWRCCWRFLLALLWAGLGFRWAGWTCFVVFWRGTKQELSCWKDASGTGCVWLTTGNSWARRVLGETGGDDGTAGAWDRGNQSSRCVSLPCE